MTRMTIAQTADWLLARDKFVILTHRKPDGDTLGSSAALCRGLRQLGKPPTFCKTMRLPSFMRPWWRG